VAAGREVIQRTRAYLRSGESFSIETTLSGGGYLETRQAAEQGFFGSADLRMHGPGGRKHQRVRARFSLGGHDVPDEDVRRRYERSLANLAPAVALAHEAQLYDNSGDQPRLVLEACHGEIEWRDDEPPAWVVASGLSH
jgi:predicted ABC-type ATPase